MLQEIRSGNGDDDGPTTLRFCKGCVAATVTTRRPCDYGVERLLGCTIARKPSQRRRSYATLAIQQRAMTNTNRRKFVANLQHAVANLQHTVANLQLSQRQRLRPCQSLSQHGYGRRGGGGRGRVETPRNVVKKVSGRVRVCFFPSSLLKVVRCARLAGGATIPGCSPSARLCQRPHS